MCLSGLALVALGIVCIAYPVSTLLSLSWLLGLIFFVGGCSQFAAWANMRHFMSQSGLMFFSALLQVIAGLLMLFRPEPMASALPWLFAFWLLVEGINLSLSSLDFKQVRMRYWWVLMCAGIVAACFGLWGLVNPNVGTTAIAVLVGVGIILDGVSQWVKVYIANKAEDRLKMVHKRFRDSLREIEDAVAEEL